MLEQKCIFILEDDRDILEALKLILTDQEYRVYPLNTVAKLELALIEAVPDLFLLDIWVGGADGRDVVRRLRQDVRTKHVPIVIVSANISTPQIAKDLKVDDFVLKPFDMEHLLLIVAKRLAKSRKHSPS